MDARNDGNTPTPQFGASGELHLSRFFVVVFLLFFILAVVSVGILLSSGSPMIDGRMWVGREVTLTENRSIPSVDSAEGTMASSSTRSSVGDHSDDSYEIDRGLGGSAEDAISCDESELEEGEVREGSPRREDMETDTSSLVSDMVNTRGQYWRSDRMDFLLKGVFCLHA